MIRKAKIQDLDNLLNLLHQLSPLKQGNDIVDKDKLTQILNKMIDNKDYYICVYEENNNIVGTATLLIQLNLSHNGRSYGHIENVVTDENFRKKGIGKKMIVYLVDKAKKVDCYKVILNCEKNNILFYKKCGLNNTGEIEMRIK